MARAARGSGQPQRELTGGRVPELEAAAPVLEDEVIADGDNRPASSWRADVREGDAAVDRYLADAGESANGFRTGRVEVGEPDAIRLGGGDKENQESPSFLGGERRSRSRTYVSPP